MARFKKFLTGEGIAVVINLDAVVAAKFRDGHTIYVILPGVEYTLRCTLDFFMDHLNGDALK